MASNPIETVGVSVNYEPPRPGNPPGHMQAGGLGVSKRLSGAEYWPSSLPPEGAFAEADGSVDPWTIRTLHNGVGHMYGRKREVAPGWVQVYDRLLWEERAGGDAQTCPDKNGEGCYAPSIRHAASNRRKRPTPTGDMGRDVPPDFCIRVGNQLGSFVSGGLAEMSDETDSAVKIK